MADAAALDAKPDGIVISNVNPAQVGPRQQELAAKFDGPILALWEPRVAPSVRSVEAA
jgi:hypothetical protein